MMLCEWQGRVNWSVCREQVHQDQVKARTVCFRLQEIDAHYDKLHDGRNYSTTKTYIITPHYCNLTWCDSLLWLIKNYCHAIRKSEIVSEYVYHGFCYKLMHLCKVHGISTITCRCCMRRCIPCGSSSADGGQSDQIQCH